LPRASRVTIGLTSGASTPDNLVGAAISRLQEFVDGQPAS
jgi:4-hydroxy-3-methylbut-2-enyl diphosphate reductase IspH